MAVESVLRKMGGFSSVLSYLGAASLFGMMCLTTADVLFRYLLNSPILGAFEITEFMVLIVIFSFLGFTQSQKSHVSVDLVINLLPRKVQIFLELINHAICFSLMALIGWMGVLNAVDLMEVGERSPNLAIPDYPFAFFLVVGCAVTAIEFLKDLIGILARWKKGAES